MDNFLLLPRALSASLFDTAFATAIGILLSRLWLEAEECGPLHTMLQRVFTLCAAAMALALPAQLWLLTATMVGRASAPEVAAQLAEVLTGTHAGRVLIPAFALGLVLLAASLLDRLLASQTRTWFALSLMTALTAVRAASGHAAAADNPLLSELVQFLHLAAIATWAGSVIAAGLLVLPYLQRLQNSGAIVIHYGKRLSNTATVALCVVMLTGLYNAWQGLGGSVYPLAHSQWGALLALKTLLVIAAIALGATSRITLRGDDLSLPQRSTRLTRWMRLEAIAMLAILFVSGWLANSAPAVAS